MEKRTRRAGVLLGVVALIAAACAPLFPGGSTVTATLDTVFAALTWDAAVPVDEGDVVASYQVTVDGDIVASVEGTSTSCTLVGLEPSSEYDVEVTAFDQQGEWSKNYTGDLEPDGHLDTTVITPASGATGGEIGCVDAADTDGDRLPDAVETDTGTFVSTSDTGTDPAMSDTDGDAVDDGDEVLGTTAGLDLPAMGTSPVHQDVLLEFDWFDDNAEPGRCGPHSHQPSAAQIDTAADALAGGTELNPDGTTGINLIADYGQGGAFTGGNFIADANGAIDGGVSGAQYLGYKGANFAANRSGYFHYVLQPHWYNTNSGSSGQAELHGDDMIVSLYCYYDWTFGVASTIIHELGHNLNIHHGGNVSTNYKPNYNSVMNYKYQFGGVDTDCNAIGNGVVGYSDGSLASLNESALRETNGICNGVDIDWNKNSVINGGTIAVDINGNNAPPGDGVLSVLTDYDDWANILFTGINDSDGAPLSEPQVITEQPVPPWAALLD